MDTADVAAEPETEEEIIPETDAAKADVLAAAGDVAKQNDEIEDIKTSRPEDLPTEVKNVKKHPAGKDTHHWYGDEDLAGIADKIKGLTEKSKEQIQEGTLIINDNPKEGRA